MNCHRIGFGFDAHDFSDRGKLRIGGVLVAELPALKGHSDGDALLHAVTDALLGAAALGDIGDMFPDTEKSIEGISSVVMLQAAVRRVMKAGYRIGNIDTTVVAARPRIGPLREKIRRSIARAARVSLADVGVKAKSPEGTRFLSEHGGIAAWAVATLIPR